MSPVYLQNELTELRETLMSTSVLDSLLRRIQRDGRWRKDRARCKVNNRAFIASMPSLDTSSSRNLCVFSNPETSFTHSVVLASYGDYYIYMADYTISHWSLTQPSALLLSPKVGSRANTPVFSVTSCQPETTWVPPTSCQSSTILE